MTTDCKICMGEHDAEIHDATLSIRAWFRHEVTKRLYDDDQPEPIFDEEMIEVEFAAA